MVNTNKKKEITFFKKVLLLVIPFFLAFLYLKPFLQYPAFNVIDDGASIWLSEKIVQNTLKFNLDNLSNLLVEKNEGRLRPLYHLYTAGIYAVFAANPLAFWIAQALLLGSSILLMSRFLYLISKNFYISLLFPLTLFLFVPTADNFYRLGTAEPKQTFFWLLLLLFCFKIRNKVWTIKRMLLAGVLLWSCLLTKETSIVFIPFFSLFWFWQVLSNKQHLKENISYGLAVILTSFTFIFLLPSKTGYAQSFSFNIHDMWLRYLSTLGGIPVLYISFVASWIMGAIRYFLEWKHFKKIPETKKYIWQILLAVQAVLLLVIGILPWEWPLPRYFYPLYVMAILATAVELSAWTKIRPIVKKISWKWRAMFTSLIFLGITFLEFKRLYQVAALSFTWESIKYKLFVTRLDVAELWLMVIFACLLIFIRIYKTKHKLKISLFLKKHRWQILIFFYLVISTFLLSVFWEKDYIHSYFIVKVSATIFFLIELSNWIHWHKEKKLSLSFISSSILGALILTYIFKQTIFQGVGNFKRLIDTSFVRPAIESMHASFDTYQISYALIDYLLKQVPADTHIYVYENEYEILFEIGLYASRFGKQPVRVITHSQQLVEETKHRQSTYAYSKYPVADFLLDKESKILLTRPLWWSQLSTEYDLSSINIINLPPAYTYNSLPSSVYWLVAY